ncbi:hypothetical protein FA95DRAFT_1216983 [Auriscalpium vulgare]|uniref:Uncharacterized protein n=1 Tax=Auriscalpium vulgare TaxID=40419 RepID=A0ACB8R4K0_9AGAM|nr:hypothetical protein FA95DRAFT_1216983 [Auriscalpium vulgare]
MPVEAPAQIAAVKGKHTTHFSTHLALTTRPGRLQTQREHDRYCAQYNRQLGNVLTAACAQGTVTGNPKANIPRTVPNWQAILLQTYGVRIDGWPEEFSKFTSIRAVTRAHQRTKELLRMWSAELITFRLLEPAELVSEGVDLGRKKQRADVGGKHARNGVLAPVLTPAVVSDADLRDDQFFAPFDPRKEFLPGALPEVIRGMKILDPEQ